MIVVIDYGMGNLRSVVKAVEKYSGDVIVSKDPASIKKATALVMPGDGAFGMAMENLKREGWIEPLLEYVKSGGYFLGICLGYQLLFSSSEEFGFHRGLDIIPGKVVRFNAGCTETAGIDGIVNDKQPCFKVPHMGWNNVELHEKSKFLEGINSESYFYFIHSFYPEIEDKSWILGEVEYSVKFACIVGKNNLIATQFHPEKSHKTGLKIIENFVRHVVC